MKATILTLLAITGSLQASVTFDIQNALDINTSSTAETGSNPWARVEASGGGSSMGTLRVASFVVSITNDTSNPGPYLTDIVAFCIELQQPIATNATGLTGDLDTLESAAASSVGNGVADGNTHGNNIPVGGIGATRAAQLRYLYDTAYKGASATDWVVTNADPDIYAFQLAVWELSHDDDFTLAQGSLTTPGDLGFWATASRNTGNGNSLKDNNAVIQAEALLASVEAANIDASYTSTKWELQVISDETNQDLILPTSMTPIPEPTTITLTLLGALPLLTRRRR